MLLRQRVCAIRRGASAPYGVYGVAEPPIVGCVRAGAAALLQPLVHAVLRPPEAGEVSPPPAVSPQLQPPISPRSLELFVPGAAALPPALPRCAVALPVLAASLLRLPSGPLQVRARAAPLARVEPPPPPAAAAMLPPLRGGASTSSGVVSLWPAGGGAAELERLAPRPRG